MRFSRSYMIGAGTATGVGAGRLNWTEYGVQVSYRLKDNIRLNAFADGLAGGGGGGGKLHVGLGVDVKF